MRYFFLLLVFYTPFLQAQKISKADKQIIAELKTHINYLADDKLEGRRTGTPGEKLAYEYIEKAFKDAGLKPLLKESNYVQAFDVNDGRMIHPSTEFTVNEKAVIAQTDFFPLPYSANKTVQCTVYPTLKEEGEIWLYDIEPLLTTNKSNPHFDLRDALKKETEASIAKGATGLIIYNSSSLADNLKFEPGDKSAPLSIPVIYLNREAKQRFFTDETARHNLKLTVQVEAKKRTGHNVVGYWDNKATNTIILGAHYDHLGYGEDKNSLYAGTEAMIHNGADDNASGTAALISMAKILQHKDFKQNNYLFVAFSGEELGLYGSKFFTENNPISLNQINYMLNMDMVGRLNDSTHGLTVGGYGTSPTWGTVIPLLNKNGYFKLKFDSSGVGPSDHTSFYKKDIPVLFFFTGTHMDYHKPGDDADKINYTGALKVVRYICSIIRSTANSGKLTFTKTRETSTGKSTFKVSLGIMPDYTFSGTGIHVDGVSSGKAAEKAGIKTGDILLQLGTHELTDVQSYMNALNTFNKGEATTVKIKRGAELLQVNVVF